MTTRSGAAPGREGDLAGLVDRTRGLQPWRRVFHVGGGLAIAAAVYRLGPASPWPPVLLGAALAVALALDAVRLRFPAANRWFFRTFSALASPREARRIASSTWYLAGVLLVSLLLPPSVLVPAVLVLAVADPAAGVVGRLAGRRRLGKGTALGSLTFVAVAAAVLAAFVPLPQAVAVALATAVLEALPLGPDDNLIVPLAVGVGLALVG